MNAKKHFYLVTSDHRVGFSPERGCMMSGKLSLLCVAVIGCLFFLASCSSSSRNETAKAANSDVNRSIQEALASEKGKNDGSALPVQYQFPAYVVDQETAAQTAAEAEATLKVGARIETRKGPQPLWTIMKGLADLKKMNISWASDVDQNAMVDVHINANDDFHEAISNLLRQLDYYHDVKGNTIVIKYKETRNFQIAMPFIKSKYTTGTGGNLLGNEEESKNIDGTIELKSKENEFDIWDNIKGNLDSLLGIWEIKQENKAKSATETDSATIKENCQKDWPDDPKMQEFCIKQQNRAQDRLTKMDSPSTSGSSTKKKEESSKSGSNSGGSANGSYYMIDKPVGLITVTAPRPLLEKVEEYISTLKKSLYQQIAIEAKIIEVQLNSGSSIGVNWSKVLKNFQINGTVQFGADGQVYPYIFASEKGYNETGQVYSADGSTHTQVHDPGRFVSKVSLETANFSAFLNALKEEGSTKVLSNPKISVMNGQPSLITVGKNVTYIDNIESKIDSETGIITYTVKTERVLSGVGMALTATILDKNEIIMNLVPVTSELVEPIEYKDIGTLGATVGLPIINVREMSTTVKIKDGEMLVIGGLISDSEESTEEFAPGIGNIPIVKYLFGHEEKMKKKRELIILLKPRII